MKKPSSYLSTYEDGTECSETSAYKIHSPGNCPEESTQQMHCCSVAVLLNVRLQGYDPNTGTVLAIVILP